MKLASGQGVALQTPLLCDGTAVLDQPAKLSAHLAWWKKQGVEGLVFYDTYPGNYERPIEHFKTLNAVLDDVGRPVGAFDVAVALGADILDEWIPACGP